MDGPAPMSMHESVVRGVMSVMSFVLRNPFSMFCAKLLNHIGLRALTVHGSRRCAIVISGLSSSVIICGWCSGYLKYSLEYSLSMKPTFRAKVQKLRRIVIPKPVCKARGIEEGDEVDIELERVEEAE